MAVESQPATGSDKDRAPLSDRVKHELKALAVTGLFFLCWIGALLLLKHLLLEEYGIEFDRLSVAFVGALILSKVVLVLEHVSLGSWLESRPAWANVLARTVLYSLGVALVLLIEKAFDGRHGYGGFVPSLQAVFQHTDIQHVYVNILCLSGALLCFNILSVIRSHLGEGSLARLFLMSARPRGQPMPRRAARSP